MFSPLRRDAVTSACAATAAKMETRNLQTVILTVLCCAGWGAFFFGSLLNPQGPYGCMSSKTHQPDPSGEITTRPTLEQMQHAAVVHASRGETLGTFTGNAEHTWPVPFYTPFHEYVKSNIGACARCPLVDKWEPYFMAYHAHFERYRGKNVTFVEVGVQSGGSALMWRWYFGPGLRYFGVDINPNTLQFANDWATIIIGDQADPEFWKRTIADHGLGSSIDIFLDDGGHTMDQQSNTFDAVYPHVRGDGIFMCEDLSTSYVGDYGGLKASVDVLSGRAHSEVQTMVEKAKLWVDWLNGYFVADYEPAAGPSARLPSMGQLFVRSAASVHFYSQMVVIQKGATVPPLRSKVGGYVIPFTASKESMLKTTRIEPYPYSVDMLADKCLPIDRWMH